MILSIIIPAHNDGHFIEGLLDSINKFITEEHEVIVVNNGSTDRTQEVLSKFECTVIDIKDKVNPSTARNIGVKKSSGKYIIFFDSDILVTEQWADQLTKLISNAKILPKYFITGCSYYMSINPSWIETYWFEPLRKKNKSYINGGNIITSLDTFEYIGGFDEHLETGEDVAFSEKAKNIGVEILINNKWKVHHEGFPKTIKNFVKREGWHGKGDFCAFSFLIKSKIAIATLIFLMLHILLLINIYLSFYLHNNIFAINSLIITALILFLSYIRAVKDIDINSFKKLLITTFISYLYFYGRSLSIVNVMKDKFN